MRARRRVSSVRSVRSQWRPPPDYIDIFYPHAHFCLFLLRIGYLNPIPYYSLFCPDIVHLNRTRFCVHPFALFAFSYLQYERRLPHGRVATNQRVKKFVLLLSLWVRAREEVELLIELLSSSSPSEGDARLEVDREREQRGFRQS